ncbi:MAG: NTP transferase domain-containing protein [Deltaproteobacteria bacterium]|nr:NTP transferase domain-containing protein [Deltaproteobacteria bacterium]
MSTSKHLWALILAGGDGTRLQSMQLTRNGQPVPKQYYPFDGRAPMIQWALDRAGRHVPEDRTVAVVARHHSRWWKTDLDALPPENVIAQPRNRGTAPGLLLPVLDILRRDPEATLMVLPSDHYVADEGVVEESLELAAEEARDGSLVLLGIQPEHANTEYGWIVPRPAGASAQKTAEAVDCFVEKPDATTAERLFNGGAVWNSFMFTVRADSLLHIYAQALPGLLQSMMVASRYRHDADGPRIVDGIYELIGDACFSKQVLQRVVSSLRVVHVPSCGWSDLGTPDRLAVCSSFDSAQLQAAA